MVHYSASNIKKLIWKTFIYALSEAQNFCLFDTVLKLRTKTLISIKISITMD